MRDVYAGIYTIHDGACCANLKKCRYSILHIKFAQLSDAVRNYALHVYDTMRVQHHRSIFQQSSQY